MSDCCFFEVDSSEVKQRWADMVESDDVSSCGWQWEVPGPAIGDVMISLDTCSVSECTVHFAVFGCSALLLHWSVLQVLIEFRECECLAEGQSASGAASRCHGRKPFVGYEGRTCISLLRALLRQGPSCCLSSFACMVHQGADHWQQS
jgi:hypothetical protein